MKVVEVDSVFLFAFPGAWNKHGSLGMTRVGSGDSVVAGFQCSQLDVPVREGGVFDTGLVPGGAE